MSATTDATSLPAAPAPRKRGRPRKHPETAPRAKLTAAERSRIVRENNWKNRPAPDYKCHQKSITAAAEVVDAMTAMRGDQTWTAFFCERFGIPQPIDRRRRLP